MICARMITVPFIIGELLPFVIFHTFCPDLISKSIRGINLNINRWIDLIEEESRTQGL
jgi:hypothetical protein